MRWWCILQVVSVGDCCRHKGTVLRKVFGMLLPVPVPPLWRSEQRLHHWRQVIHCSVLRIRFWPELQRLGRPLAFSRGFGSISEVGLRSLLGFCPSDREQRLQNRQQEREPQLLEQPRLEQLEGLLDWLK